MKRLLLGAVALVICGVVAINAYAMAGHALEMARATLTGLDRPVSADATPVVFRVEAGQSAGDIGAALEARGLIRSARMFRLLVERDGVAGRLAAGEYELKASLSTPEVIEVLAGGRVRPGTVLTVPEGWRAEEIAWKLDSLLPGRGRDFLAIVYDDQEAATRLGLPPDASLEGFLFPDTYELARDQDLRSLVDKMVAQFDRRFDAVRRGAAASAGLSPLEAVTLASIVEREAAVPEERPLIAAVYRNRLALGMRLQADPTVQYALGTQRVPTAGQGLWPRELSLADLEVPSPYNTYRERGLPPGPICNPGLASLDAVLRPADTDALYFVARGDGSHVFAQTMDEHLSNIRRLEGGGRY
jgi:UPF0755 protein